MACQRETECVSNVPNSIHGFITSADNLEIKMEPSDPNFFDYEYLCIICGTDASAGFIKKQQKYNQRLRTRVTLIKKSDTAQRIIDSSYKSDEKFREEVRARITDKDLVALNARYHQKCYNRFGYVPTGGKRGRPKAEDPPDPYEDGDQEPEDILNNLFDDILISNDCQHALLLQEDSTQNNEPSTPESEDTAVFNFDTNCFLCGKEASNLFIHKLMENPCHERIIVNFFKKQSTVDKLQKVVTSCDDIWCRQVCARMKGKNLTAADLRYHTTCLSLFIEKMSKGHQKYKFDESLQDWHDIVDDECPTTEHIQETTKVQHNAGYLGEDRHNITENPHNLRQNRLYYREPDTIEDLPEQFDDASDTIEDTNQDDDNTDYKFNDLHENVSSENEHNAENSCAQKIFFDYENLCIICGTDASAEFIKKQQRTTPRLRIGITFIKKSDTVERLINSSYKSDEQFREEVRARLTDIDLLALNARFHRKCYRRFGYVPTGGTKGRPRAEDPPDPYEDGDQEPEDILNNLFDDILIGNDCQHALQLQEDCTQNNEPSTPESEDTAVFNFDTNCFLCGKDASDIFIEKQMVNPSHKSIDVNLVKKQTTVDKLQKVVTSCDDVWCRQVCARMKGKNLSAADLRYHTTCLSLFIEKMSKGHQKYKFDESLQDWHDIVDDECPTTEHIQETTKVQHNAGYLGEDRHNTRQNRLDYLEPDTIEDLPENFNDNDDTIEDINQDDHNTHYKPDNLHENEHNTGYQVQTRSKVKPQYCYACLSGDRRVYRLGHYARVFSAICGKTSKKSIHVCWECLGVLRKIKEFKDRVEKAREMWNEVQHLQQSNSPGSLSTLAEIRMCNIDFSCHTDTQNLTYPRIHSEGYTKRHFIKTETEHENITSSQIYITEPFETQANAHEDFGSDEESFGMDDVDAEISVKQDSVHNDISAIIQNLTTKNKTDEEAQETLLESVEPDITDGTSSSSSSSSDSDPDFDPEPKNTGKINKKDCNSENKPKKTEQIRTVRKNRLNKRCKITYDNSNVVLVVRKLKIQSKDATAWMKRERNSEFFRKLKKKCELCVSRLSPNQTLQRHLETLHQEAPSSHTCTICKIVFKSLDKLKSHLYHHTFVLRCGFCGYLCYGKHNMLDHLGRHRRTIECLECGDRFRFAKDFKAHYRLNHSSFKCDKCSKQFNYKERLLHHVDNYHTPKSCSQCKKTFVNAVKLGNHMKFKHEIDRSEQNYCVTCGLQLRNRVQFKHHLYSSPRHADERPAPPKPKVRVACEACPKTFCSRDSMRRHHRKVHLRMKLFCCTICDKDFRTSTVLRDHVRYVHEGVARPRDHVCHICARGFTVRKTLVHHLHTHTGEKPHQCPHCDACFIQRTAMVTHIKKRHK